MDNDDSCLGIRRLQPGDPQVGQTCFFCRQRMAAGDLIKVVNGGPANDVELARARQGLPYTSGPPLQLHDDCGDPQGLALAG